MNEGGISAIAQGYENLGKGTMAQWHKKVLT